MIDWADVLTPPYFQKFKHGSEKTPVTPMTPSMEWNVPSPPDFHHFNMVRLFFFTACVFLKRVAYRWFILWTA